MVLDTNSHHALLRAISASRPRQVRLLLESGIGVNVTDSCGQSPLIRAIFIENTRYRMKIIRLLLRRRASVGHRDCVGRNALAWACLRGLDRVAELLIHKGDGDIDLNDVDMNKCTPLFHAATRGDAATVKMMVDALCRYDLSVDISNDDGLTPLMQAIRLGNDVCASILLNQGKASVTVRDNNHRSAIDWAEITSKNCDQPSVLHLIKQVATSRRLDNRLYGRHISLVKTRVTEDGYWASDNERSNVPKKEIGNDYDNDKVNDEDTNDESDESVCRPSADDNLTSFSSSSSSSSCNSSPEIIRRFPTICNIPLIIGDQLGDSRPNTQISYDNRSKEHDVDMSKIILDSVAFKNINKQITSPNDCAKFNSLPKLYGLLSDQLCDTFRPGAAPRTARRSPSAISDDKVGEHDDCRMECCVSSGPSPVPEKMRQSVVQANRRTNKGSVQARLDGSPRNGPANTALWKRAALHSTRFPSLRRQVTKRRFLEAQTADIDAAISPDKTSTAPTDSPVGVEDPNLSSNDHHGNGEPKSNFPAISAGKPSLVGDAGVVMNSDEFLKRDLDRILTANMKGLSF